MCRSSRKAPSDGNYFTKRWWSHGGAGRIENSLLGI